MDAYIAKPVQVDALKPTIWEVPDSLIVRGCADRHAAFLKKIFCG